MTTIIERPTDASLDSSDSHHGISPVSTITTDLGQVAVLEVDQAYHSLGERPIPICDAKHAFVNSGHIYGYKRHDGTVAAPCTSPGKAPLERDYPRFAETAPSALDIV